MNTEYSAKTEDDPTKIGDNRYIWIDNIYTKLNSDGSIPSKPIEYVAQKDINIYPDGRLKTYYYTNISMSNKAVLWR